MIYYVHLENRQSSVIIKSGRARLKMLLLMMLLRKADNDFQRKTQPYCR